MLIYSGDTFLILAIAGLITAFIFAFSTISDSERFPED